MAIATTTAIILAVTAASAAAKAKIDSNAAKNAAKTQTAAANTARGDIERERARFRTDFAPYQSAGTGAITTIAERLGLPKAPAPPVQQPPVVNLPGGDQPRDQPTDPSQGPQTPMPLAQRVSALSSGGARGSQTVMLEAPTGERMAVPVQSAQMYIAKGARRVA